MLVNNNGNSIKGLEFNLFGWKDSLSATRLPVPFTKVDQKTATHTDPVTGTSVKKTLMRAFIKAMLYYAKSMNMVENKKVPEILAIGTNSSDGDEEIVYVELSDPEYDPDLVTCVTFNPSNGKLSGCVYKISTGKAENYSVKAAGRKLPDATAVWVALLPTLVVLSSNILRAVNMLTVELDSMDADDAVDFCNAYLYDACYDAYCLLVKETEPIVVYPSDDVSQIKTYDLEKKIIGPARGKVEFGEFKVFPVLDGISGLGNFSVNFDVTGYNLPFQKTEFTEAEKLLIPTIPADNVTPKEAIEILDEMTDTWNNSPATKVTQIMLEGCAGSGKSYLARLIAAALKRPFVSFTCSPNTDEADIKGALLPVASDEQMENLPAEDAALLKVIYDSTDDTLYDNMAAAMGLPDTMECMFAPDSAFEQITGIQDENADSQKAYSALCNAVMGKVKSLMRAARSVAPSSGGVQYKYIPSPIVRAVKNGYLLELQEPSCMIQQGMLSCLFDVLDKESIGVLNTTTGDIYRHPDFMCITTTNRKYKGTKPLNEAARSRFQYFCKMETPDKEVIAMRVAKKCGITDFELMAEITDVYKKLEERAEEINAAGAVTMRGLFSFADAINRGKDANFALLHYLIYAVTTDDEEIEELKDAVQDCRLIRG